MNENGIGYDRMDRTTIDEWRRIEDRFYATRPHVVRRAPPKRRRPGLFVAIVLRLKRWWSA